MNWLADLEALAYRVQGCGIGPDLAALTIVELWGLYGLLRHLAEAG